MQYGVFVNVSVAMNKDPYKCISDRFAYQLPKEYQHLQERGWLTLDRPRIGDQHNPWRRLFVHA
jgi:hypothetical protein